MPLRKFALAGLLSLALVSAPVSAALGTTDGGSLEGQPTQAQIDAAAAEVSQAGARAQQAGGAVSSAQAKLTLAAQTSGLALERYSAAVRALDSAQQAEQTQADRLTAADAELATSRDQLGRWARDAYQDGSQLNSDPMLNVLLRDPVEPGDAGDGDVTTTMAVLRRIGNGRSAALAQTTVAVRRQAAITQAAADAGQAAATAAVAAAAARTAADAALVAQRTALGQAESDQQDAQSDLDAAKQRKAAITAQSLIGGVGIGSTSAHKDNAVTGEVGSCKGGDDVQQYPNGQIPVAALCPLWSSPGHVLRADAAFAFNRMSEAYAAHFGTPICVTDSYRTLAEQISVYARKPGLAAIPGTSNHGWGTATDLCGGIESFTSAQHAWLLLNAPLYDWFHPSWAEPTGSRPEPWHWEYAG